VRRRQDLWITVKLPGEHEVDDDLDDATVIRRWTAVALRPNPNPNHLIAHAHPADQRLRGDNGRTKENSPSNPGSSGTVSTTASGLSGP
jgi:hypothetical protein